MDSRDTEEIIEVDCDLNPTDLYTSICALDWKRALRALEKNPIESRIWVVKRDPYSDKDDDDAVRFLPLHSACARQPPLDIVIKLLSLYSEASSIIDDNGMYPLHYACANQASAEVIELLLVHYPQANNHRVEMNGSLPIHLSAQWGVSSPVVMKLLLNQNTSLACARDNDDLSPLELAINAEDYEYKDEVIDILRRCFEREAQYDGDDSTISTQFSNHEKEDRDSSEHLVELLEKMKNEVIELHQRKSRLKKSVENQIQLEWEAVNLTLQQMKTQLVEMKTRKQAALLADSHSSSPKSVTCSNGIHPSGAETKNRPQSSDKTKNTMDMDDDDLSHDDSTADSTNSNLVSNVEYEAKPEESLEKVKSLDHREMGLQKISRKLSNKFSGKLWLPNWRRVDRRESRSIDESCPDYEKYGDPTDDNESNVDHKIKGESQHDPSGGRPLENLVDDAESLDREENDSHKKSVISTRTYSTSAANNPSEKDTTVASGKIEQRVETSMNASQQTSPSEGLERNNGDTKSPIKSEQSNGSTSEEKMLAEIERKMREIQNENIILEREISHLTRRRNAYASKVNAVEGSVGELSEELRKVMKIQNNTIGRIQESEKHFQETSAMRRKYLKLMLRDIENDQRLQGRMAGCEGLLKREMKAAPDRKSVV